MTRVSGGLLAAIGASALAVPLAAHMVTRSHKSNSPSAPVTTAAAASRSDCGKPVKRDRYAVVVKKATPTKEHDATRVITNHPAEPPRQCP